jgi:predicted RNA binding protein YcfA (HicA-like mRNA interferase family)
MAGNLYPDLTRQLRAAGWTLHRQGKGAHEIWKNADKSKSVTVPKAIRKRHTANAILKQAGLPKAF